MNCRYCKKLMADGNDDYWVCMNDNCPEFKDDWCQQVGNYKARAIEWKHAGNLSYYQKTYK